MVVESESKGVYRYFHVLVGERLHIVMAAQDPFYLVREEIQDSVRWLVVSGYLPSLVLTPSNQTTPVFPSLIGL